MRRMSHVCAHRTALNSPLTSTWRQMNFYDIDGQTDVDGKRMFEYVSLHDSAGSAFAPDTYLLGSILTGENLAAGNTGPYVAINGDALDAPFPSSAQVPGTEALKAVTSFPIIDTASFSATFSAPPRSYELRYAYPQHSCSNEMLHP